MSDHFSVSEPTQLLHIAKQSFAKRNFARAFDYLLRAISLDHSMAEAHFWLGWAYYLGWHEGDSKPDIESATNAFLLSAQQKNASAQNNVAALLEVSSYTNSDGDLTYPLLAEAERWFSSAAQHGLSRALYNLGRIYQTYSIDYAGRDESSRQGCLTSAESYYRSAAGQGITEASYELGMLLLNSLPEPEPRDTTLRLKVLEAGRWFLKAALDDFSDAQFELGRLIELGSSIYFHDGQIAQTPEQVLNGNLPMSRYYDANYWYRMAAEQGNRSAQHALGMNLALGLGAKKDIAGALHWFHEALRNGFGRSVSAIMHFADTSEFESFYPNVADGAKYQAVKSTHQNALDRMKSLREDREREELISRRMCSLPCSITLPLNGR